MTDYSIFDVAAQAEQLRNLQRFIKQQSDKETSQKLDDSSLLYMKNKLVKMESDFDETISNILNKR